MEEAAFTSPPEPPSAKKIQEDDSVSVPSVLMNGIEAPHDKVAPIQTPTKNTDPPAGAKQEIMASPPESLIPMMENTFRMHEIFAKTLEHGLPLPTEVKPRDFKGFFLLAGTQSAGKVG